MPQVDLYVSTLNCEMHSRRNHDKTRPRGALSLWRRSGSASSMCGRPCRMPGVVVLESVHEVSSVGPLTGLLARIGGYKLRSKGKKQ